MVQLKTGVQVFYPRVFEYSYNSILTNTFELTVRYTADFSFHLFNFPVSGYYIIFAVCIFISY